MPPVDAASATVEREYLCGQKTLATSPEPQNPFKEEG
jgi:hypothetical protein